MHNIQISPKLCSEDIYYVGYTARECYKPSGLRPYVLLDIDKNSMEIHDLIQTCTSSHGTTKLVNLNKIST